MSFWFVLLNTAEILFAPFLFFAVFAPKILRYIKRGRGTFLRRIFSRGKVSPGGVWFQASSIGEAKIAVALARRLKAKKIPMYLFAMTPEGRSFAEKQNVFNGCFLAPLDFYFIVEKFMKNVRPKCVILVELQLWPNLIETASRLAQVAIVNGRLSDRSFPRYRVFRFLVRRLLSKMAFISARTEKDRRRFILLGAPREKVFLSGNIKYDILFSGSSSKKRKADFGIPDDKIVITCGSTHSGEEEIIVEAVRRLPENVFCVIVPRHIERAPEVEKIFRKFSAGYSVFSRNGGVKNGDRFLLVDAFGVLNDFYAIADFCFVGGSLVGKGGQNFVEAVGCGKPVVVGPHNENFHQEFEILKNYLFVAQTPEEVYAIFRNFLEKPEAARRKADQAYSEILSVSGALDKNLKFIEGIL
ncbi:MAG: glycosyltransferase [Elusimicrobia bacterium]|nr:glycosyltransferase [Elusimicrobiota bacterium]